MHGCKAIFAARADASPDAVFSGDEVGKAFTDQGEANEGGRVAERGLEEDVGEGFGGNGGDGTGWLCGGVGRRFFTGDGKGGEGGDEFVDWPSGVG